MLVILSADKLSHMTNIVEVVTADKNLTSLGKGMKAAGLEEVLSTGGPYTIFAPSDIAFGKLQTGILADLLKPENKAKLADILSNHVVKGKTNFKELTDGQKLTTLGGKELHVVVKNGDVDIEGSRVQGRDMDSSNGVVHSIDKVVLFN